MTCATSTMEDSNDLRWTEPQTREFLEVVRAGVQNNEFCQFVGEEKWNSRELYEWVAARVPSLRAIDWKSIRDQMRLLTKAYLEAAELQKEADDDTDHLIEHDVTEQIHEICPFWNLLHEIFERTPTTQKIEIDDNDGDEDDNQDAASADSYQNDSDTLPLPIEDDDDDEEMEEEDEEAEHHHEHNEPFEEILMTEKRAKTAASSSLKKTRRPRLTQYRWWDKETQRLLDAIWNAVKRKPKSFEQPTARQFYGKIFPKVHHAICKNKMRHLRASYKSAIALQQQQASTAATERLDEAALKIQLQRVCPLWEQLHQIFGSKSKSPKIKVQNLEPAETHIKIEPVLINDDVIDGSQPEENEPSYSDDEGDKMFEPTEAKHKREPSRILHRWRNTEITKLLKIILNKVKHNSEAFEKPTAQIFYELLFPSLTWGACKGKMRYLKASYVSAVAFRRKHQTLDEGELNEKVRKICPYWDLLHQIFGQRTNDRFGNAMCASDDIAEKNDDSVCSSAKSQTNNASLDTQHNDSGESSHSEDAYPFDNEDAIYNPVTTVKKRNYKNGMHRWQHNETIQLLKMVLAEVQQVPRAFEKPTAQMFYQKVFPEQSFRACQGRMRYLKKSYVSAIQLRKQQVGINLGLDEDSHKEEIRKVCPYWDLLHQIYKLHTNPMDDTFFIGLSDNEQDDAYNSSSGMPPTASTQKVSGTAALEEQNGAERNDGIDNEHSRSNETHNLNTEKTSRLRLKGVHRWKHSETKQLLKMIVNEIKHDPDVFEKPTSRIFYTKVYPRQNWSTCKFRLRYLKTQYVAAIEMREQQMNINLELDEDALKEQIRKVCPYWDLLHQIHGQRLNVKGDKLLIGFNDDDDDDENDDEDEEEDNQLIPANSTRFVNSTPSMGNAQNVSLQADKLKLERTKVMNDLEMRKLELKQQFDLKRLELERDERLALARLKLEVESQERLKKYELDLKLKNNSYPF